MALIRTKTIAKAKERSSTVTKGGVTYQKVDTAALAEVATIAKNLAENSSDWAKIDQKDRAVLAAAMQALAEASAALDGKYLSKTGDDTAEGVITFKNGLISLALALLQGGAEYGRFVEGVSGGRIDADGNGELENLTVRDSIVVPNLTVTKAAHFFKLIIDELKSIGGQIIVTAANATLDKVVAMTSTGNEAGDGDTIAYWRCYFRAKDADGKAIHNQFDQNDMAVCMTFDAAEGTSYNVSNKYYWRKVITTGTATLTDEETGEDISYHYIDLSATDKDPDCNGVPEVGDAVAQLGNSSDTTRQNAIIISAYQGIDTSVEAPSIVQYKGIKDYGLRPYQYNVIAANGNVFRGDFRSISSSTADQSLDELISGLSGQVDQVKGQVDNKFEIWYGHGTPTLNNEPAVNWTDEETRNRHLQDIYYDLDREPASNGGNYYRFELTNGVYGWNLITDEHTLMALNKIADVASDGKLTGGMEKTRVYIDWMKAVQDFEKYGEQACDYAIDEQDTPNAYSVFVDKFRALANMLDGGSSDYDNVEPGDEVGTPSWLLDLAVTTTIAPTTATEYRNTWNEYYEALASLMKEIQRQAKLRADNAQSTANEAMTKISEMGNDNMLDPSEKLTVKREFIACYHEMMDTEKEGYASGILDMAKDANNHWIISYDKYIQPYYDAFLALGQYLDGSEQWQFPLLADFDDADLPSWIQEENMGNTNTIDGDVWRSLWADFYTKRTAVLTALTSHAQETAESKVNVFVTSYDDKVPHPVPPYKAGDIWLHTLSDGQRKTYIAIVTKTSGSYDPSDWKDMTDIKPSFRTMVEKMLLDGTIRTYIEDAISNSTSFRIWFANGNGYRIIQDTSSNRYILQQYVSEEWVAVTSSKGWIAYYHGSGNLFRGIYVYSGTSWIKITNDGLSSVMEEILTCWGERYSTCYTDKSSSATDKDLCIRDVGYWDALENKQQSTGLREIFMYNQIQWELISDSITSLLENLGDKIRALVYDANGHSLIDINANNILLETAARLEGDRKNFPVLKPWWDTSTGETCIDYLRDPIRYNGNNDIYSYPTWLKKGTYKLKFFASCSQSHQLSSIAICQYGTTFPSDRATYQSIELPDLTYDGTTLSGMYGFGGVVEIPSDGYYALNWWESYYIYIPDMSEESESLVAQLAAGLATKVNATGSGANAFATLFANAVDNNDDIVKQAQLVTYVEMDKNGKIVSGISLDADQVNFTANKVMINNKFWIDADGNVCMANATVSGTIKAEDGEIGGFNIGTDKLSNTNYGASIEIANAASNPTKRTIIGKAAVDTFTNRECSMVAENKESGQTYNTALFLNAENAIYNYAFHGNGNGVLNGLMFGYKTQNKAVTMKDQSLGSISLTDGATILVTGSYGGNHTITLPQLSNVRKCLGISDVLIPFSIEVEIINLTSGNLNMRFRGYEGYTSVEYPYLMSNNGGTESGGAAITTITPGGYVKMRLIYVNDGKSYRAHRLVYNHE